MAVALAKACDRAVVINADASQVYADLAILSARPAAAEMEGVPHRLFGHVDAAETCNAARWAAEARGEIARAHAAGACAVQTPRSQSPLLRPDALLAAGTGAAVGVDHLQLTREEQEQAHVAAQNPAESAWGPVDLAWRTVVRSGPPSIPGPPAVRRDLEY